MTVRSYPLSIAFAPRTTVPTLSGRTIIETSDHTCTYKGKKYSLNDVQIGEVLHRGYLTPGMNDSPVAELILSFTSNVAANDLSTTSGILLCLPLYHSGEPAYHRYLTDIVEQSPRADVATLESLFYASAEDTNQRSLAYKTCFETVDDAKQVRSKSLYVVVFPKGIHLPSQVYATLLQQLGGTLHPYAIPPALRDARDTVLTYRVDSNGAKLPEKTSRSGIISVVQVSTSTDDFKNRFEYFTSPPRRPTSGGATCANKYYTTSQYKCVPFNQLTDLDTSDKTHTYVRPGSKSLDTILDEKKTQDTSASTTNAGLTTAQLEEIVGGSISGFLLLAFVLFLIHNAKD